MNIWTKKLDTLHFTGEDSHCLCGKAMLGNNYADSYREIDKFLSHIGDREFCKVCARKVTKAQLLEMVRQNG